MTGAGGAFGVSIGGMIIENLGVFGELSDSVTVSPKLKIGGKEFDTEDDVSVGIVGIGAGVIYYVMPMNV